MRSKGLSGIEIAVPAIPIPSLLAAFRHIDYKPVHAGDDGFAALLAPSNSPLQSLAQLHETLSKAQQALTAVKNLGNFAATLAGLGSTIKGVTASQFFSFVSGDEIRNLSKFTPIRRVWFDDDTELEDEISSMIMIGAPERAIDFYVARAGWESTTNEGHFDLKVGPDNFTAVHNLHPKFPEHPETNPPQMLRVFAPPKSGIVADKISSLKWRLAPAASPPVHGA